MAVPLASIGGPTRVDGLRAETVNCCVPGFQVLDEIHCVNNLILSTPAESLQALSQYVDSLDLHRGTERSLLAKLGAALRSLERGRQGAAANQLEAFIHHVHAQSGKKIPVEEAEWMISEAESILASI